MPTPTETRALALRLFDELGRELLGESLRQRGWTFGFDRARTRLGVCRPSAKRITLSAHLSRSLPAAEVEDTVRHEIAHALDHELHPNRRGRRAHDRTWKALARRCGATPERCFDGDLPDDPAAPYTAVCPSCGASHDLYRQPVRAHLCPTCSRPSRPAYLRVTHRPTGRGRLAGRDRARTLRRHRRRHGHVPPVRRDRPPRPPPQAQDGLRRVLPPPCWRTLRRPLPAPLLLALAAPPRLAPPGRQRPRARSVPPRRGAPTDCRAALARAAQHPIRAAGTRASRRPPAHGRLAVPNVQARVAPSSHPPAMSYTLRLGHRAATTASGPVRIPIEGARAVLDQGAVVVLVGYCDPSPAECAAVERAPVELALLAGEAVAALLFQIGAEGDPGCVTSAAPVNVLDPDAEPGGFLDEASPAPVRFALCDSETGVVRALREVDPPADLLAELRARLPRPARRLRLRPPRPRGRAPPAPRRGRPGPDGPGRAPGQRLACRAARPPREHATSGQPSTNGGARRTRHPAGAHAPTPTRCPRHPATRRPPP